MRRPGIRCRASAPFVTGVDLRSDLVAITLTFDGTAGADLLGDGLS